APHLGEFLPQLVVHIDEVLADRPAPHRVASALGGGRGARTVALAPQDRGAEAAPVIRGGGDAEGTGFESSGRGGRSLSPGRCRRVPARRILLTCRFFGSASRALRVHEVANCGGDLLAEAADRVRV